MIALIAAAGAVVLFKLAQRSKITPDELDRTTSPPETTVAPLRADGAGERLRKPKWARSPPR